MALGLNPVGDVLKKADRVLADEIPELRSRLDAVHEAVTQR
jgi:hypothetical protein